MTSGRFHINGEATGSGEHNSSATATSTTQTTNTTGAGGGSSSSSGGSNSVDIRENEKIRTFVFTSRGSSSNLQRTERQQLATAAGVLEEVEVKIPEVCRKFDEEILKFNCEIFIVICFFY